ncbi:MAG TPA: hypothetical protein VJ782_06320 [Aeromicrobium sp.]|nr:hypothetical protein [Aeromicrobium sp.]
MNRHPFRWEALAFGLLFLAVVGTWTAWKTGVLASDQLAYAPAGTLIVLGIAGIIATFSRPASKRPVTTAGDEPAIDNTETSEAEEVPGDVEEIDPQP